MAQANGVREVSWVDCAGGGQIVVEKGLAYIGHMSAPNGTSIYDVRDPKNVKHLSTIEVPKGSHSHKVHAHNGIMVVNREQAGKPSDDWRGGFEIFDISDPTKPKSIHFWKTVGTGMHRFSFDGRYLYGSPTLEGYVGNVMGIFDLKNPEKPELVGHWHMPGQHTAGGETPTWKGTEHRCHHPLRMGDRLYTSYWQGGFVILDISDMSKPRLISGLDWSPPYPCPTHSAVPVPFEIAGRKVLLVADEDVNHAFAGPPGCLWVVDITMEDRPVPIASFQVEEVDDSPHPKHVGCHQPIEKITGTQFPAAWFSNGMRIIDVARPRAPKEVARFIPDPPPGADHCLSNDVFVDDRGLIFLLDRIRGFHILERL